jgi:tetratricopeptide (TPR) repeat protein
MRLVMTVVLFAALAIDARAADKPAIGPPAAWVVAAPAPQPGALPPIGVDAAPVRSLLVDRQVHFAADGIASYTENITRAQTPQGLAALGTIVLPWNPELDTLTIHKLHILRGDQVIDVLAHQSVTILRRENNLERAMLDGMLSAAVQTEGLQVGDIVDLAATVVHKDPALKGHREMLLENAASVPLEHLRVRAVWDRAASVRWRAPPDLPAPKSRALGAATEFTIEARDLQPARNPAGAPKRFSRGREVAFSDFGSWAEVAALLAPLYDKASTLPAASPLKAEAAKIRASSGDPRLQAAAALALVQDQVRYFFVGMNDGGLVPADADTTWTRRFGDCKGKTALLLALLRELGIDAQPALVSTRRGDGLDQRLPTLQEFDHVIVRASIGARVYWLDGARTGDASLDAIRMPPFKWALPVQASGATLAALLPVALTTPDLQIALRLDASAGLDAPAPAHAELILRGDWATAFHTSFANLSGENLDNALRSYWRGRYGFIDIQSVSASFDPKTGVETLRMDGVAHMAWDVVSSEGDRRYELDEATLAVSSDLHRDPGPNADAPFAVDFPYYASGGETIVLPRGGAGFTIEGGDIDRTIAGAALTRHAAIDKGVLTMQVGVRTVQPEFPASEADAAMTALRDLAKQGLYVRAPAHYRPTDADLAAAQAREPGTADEYLSRGRKLLDAGKTSAAQSDFDKAIALAPNVVDGYAASALSHMAMTRLDLAHADLAKGAAIAPDDAKLGYARTLLALLEGKREEAIAAISAVIDRAPTDGRAFYQRARIYEDAGDLDKALADANEAVRLSPSLGDARETRATIQLRRRAFAPALADIDAALAADPAAALYHTRRGDILRAMNRVPDALRAYERSLELQPSVEVYLAHAAISDKKDVAARLRDVDGALRLEPKSADALSMQGAIYADAGDIDNAIAAYTASLAIQPDAIGARLGRAAAFAKGGRTADALRDIAQARAKAAGSADRLNEICWSGATHNIALDDALADCTAALRLTPRFSAALDSRGFVNLRLGRLDDALADYNAALALTPDQPASLYGRGLTEMRKGLTGRGAADLASARALAPGIDDEFRGYGVTP